MTFQRHHDSILQVQNVQNKQLKKKLAEDKQKLIYGYLQPFNYPEIQDFLGVQMLIKELKLNPQNRLTLSYGSLSPLSFPPPPPTHLIIIVEVTELVLPLPGEGVLPIMAYMGGGAPKRVPFLCFRYMKGQGFYSLKCTKGQGNLSFGSVKGPKG